MSDSETGELTTEYVESGSGASEDAQKEFAAITSQEQLDKIVGARVGRERAKYSDYDDLKAKAAKLDEAEQAKKSEIQKAIERAEAAEKRAEAAELGGLRAEVARSKGVPVGSVLGVSKEEMEASADELIKWRDGAEAEKVKKDRRSSLKSGASPATDGALTGKERAAAALRTMRGS